MALANFFEKNALAAHQILSGLTTEVLTERLDHEAVGLAIDEDGAESKEGRITAELALGLLARFYPRIRLIPLDRSPATQAVVQELTSRALAINPVIDLSDSEQLSRVLVVGSSHLPWNASTIVYLGSAGWEFRLSPDRPVGSERTGNPFGAGAAACMGVANVFRAVMAEHLPGSRLDGEVSASVIGWGSPADGVPIPDLDATTIHLSETLLGGVGAIGNAVVWALARTPRIAGGIRLIDPELVDLSNLQRYVLTTQESVGKSKVEIAAAVLRRAHPQLEVTTHPVRWGAYLDGRGNWRIPRVATAFDSPADRVAAQAALPHHVLNAWTQLGDLGVSRHVAFGSAPCLSCLYVPKLGGKSLAERVSADLGFAGAPPEIRHLLYTGEPVSEEFVRRVAANLSKTKPEELAALLRYAGQPLHRFHSETVCGGVMLELGIRPGEHRIEAPMAFQSVLAGILLAAEIVLDADRTKIGTPYTGPVRTVVNMLRPMQAYPHPQISRREGCICSDPDYLAGYQGKYGAPAALAG